MQLERVIDFDDRHGGDVFLTHRWQKHAYQTSAGTLLVPVHHCPPGAPVGQTHIYRQETGWDEFHLAQTLSDADIEAGGDVNAGIVVEGDDGSLYATGHSRRSLTGSPVDRAIDAMPFSGKLRILQAMATKPTRHRTNVVYRSRDDGRTWSVLRDRTAQSRPDPPHPHNAFWDDTTGTLWWLVGHDGVRLQRYDPSADRWADAYTGTLVEDHDRLPLAMARVGDRLWLACEVSGPDGRQLYYSDDDGTTWNVVETEFRNPQDAENDALWSVSHAPDTGALFVGGGRINTGRSFVSKSADGGESWETVYSGRKQSDAWTTYFDGTLFVGDGPGPLLYSTDGGESFTEFPVPQPSEETTYPNFEEYGIRKFGDEVYLVGRGSFYRVTGFEGTEAAGETTAETVYPKR